MLLTSSWGHAREKWGFNRALGDLSKSAGSAGSDSQNRSVVWASRFKKVPFLRAPTPPQTLPQERFSQAIGWLSQPASQASE